MSAKQIAAAVRARAEHAREHGELERARFLKTLAGTISSGAYNTGNARGNFVVLRTSNGVTVSCGTDEQIQWVEALCHTVKINFLTPTLRPRERKLFIR